MRKKKTTIKEMAALLKVSVATISKALRDSTDISDEMKKKVKSLADELNYRPNLLAKNLINQQSNLLGVIIPDLRISFFSEAVRGIYEQARKENYQPLLMVNDDNPKIEKENLEFLSDINVDGILLNPAPGKENHQFYEQLAREGIKIVCWDRRIEGLGFSSVTIDDYQAAYQLTVELINQNRKNIVYMGLSQGFSVVEQRFKGFLQAMGDHKLEPNIIQSDLQADVCYKALKTYLKQNPPPDAVFCVGGLVAYGAGHAIIEHGLHVPEDIVIGEFGDNNIIAQLGVSYISIDQNPYLIGKRSVDLIITELLNKKPPKEKHIKIDTKIVRHEVGKPVFRNV